MKFDFYQTFGTQFELLPRITIIYGYGRDSFTEISHNGVAFEWLWFGLFIGKEIK